jgi:exodeoxyribonuclease VII large subunit
VRGGGSLEDLWAFNDEAVARAVVAMPMPVVAGVGHETDVTIADLAADRRAATPTAAAELASAGWFAAAAHLASLAEALARSATRQVETLMQRLDSLGHRLVHPAERLARNRRQLEHLATRLRAAAGQRLHRRQGEVADLRWRLTWARPDVRRLASRVDGLAAALSALSPQATLARGYAIVRDEAGQIVRAGSQLRPDTFLSLRFSQGGAEAVVRRIFPD